MIPCNIISLAYKALQVHASKLVQMIGVLSFPKMNNYTHTHTLPLLYPFIHRQALGLCPCPGYCE